MASSPARPANLPSLDLGRFAAALLVAFFHVSITVTHFVGKIPFDGFFRGGHSGVGYFFVLSGFIILYVHRADIHRPGRVGNFARKRIIRIVPVLWATMIGWGLIRLYLPGGTVGALDPMMILYDCLLLPHPAEDGVMGAVWTLRRELVFYLLFAVAILNRRAGISLLILWQAAIVANLIHPFFDLGPEPDMLLGVHNLGFGVGLLLALWLPPRPLPAPMLLIAVGIVVYAGTMIAEWQMGNPSHLELIPMSLTLNALLYLGASAVLVIGMVSLDIRKPRPRSGASGILGDCSYALYLTHGPISSIAIRLFQPLWPWLSPEMLTVSLVLVTIAVAIAINLWFEKPVTSLLRSWSGIRRQDVPPSQKAEV